MSFASYVGTPFEPFILPIIPLGAPLSPHSKLTPDKIGKIPGWRYDEGWGGFPKTTPWNKFICKPGHLQKFPKWYSDLGRPEIVGIQTKRFPACDVDWDDPKIAKFILDIAQDELGASCVRFRSNSGKALILYRLKEDEEAAPPSKIRRVYESPFGERGAVELLCDGQQCLLEGEHPSGVNYEWVMGMTPAEFGADNLPRIGAADLDRFFARLDRELTALSFTLVKGTVARLSGADPAKPHEVGPDHPELCPDLAMLREVLEILPSDHPEFSTYDEWVAGFIAIATACGKDETFYEEVVLPWAEADPRTTDIDYIRAKWESVNESAIGWGYLCHIAHDYGFYADVAAQFEALGELPVIPDQASGPTPRLDGTYESVIADHFVAKHAGKDWIYVHANRNAGDFYRCSNGIWRVDSSLLYDVSLECQARGVAIRANSQATPAQLKVAERMFSARSAQSVATLVRHNPAILREPKELDGHRLVLGVPGGYIDPDGKLRDPDPGLLLTKSIAVRPDFSGRCPLFEARLMAIANGDVEVYTLLWDLIGYSLSGLAVEQCFIFILGKAGGEGKTTLTSILGDLFGDYGRPISNKAFVKTKFEQRFSLASLHGFYFVYSNEVEPGEEWAPARMKEVTGGGKMEIERKNVMAEPMTLSATLWFTGNFLPKFPPSDPALQRRMILIETCTPIAKSEDKKGYAKLIVEREGPAIVARAIEARQAYIQRGHLLVPDSIIQRVQGHFLAADPIWQFFEDRAVWGAEHSVLKQDVYDAFVSYMRRTGLMQNMIGRTTFYDRVENHAQLKKMGVSSTKVRFNGSQSNRQQAYKGMKLLPAFEGIGLDAGPETLDHVP